jgi:hypothetical protein
MRRRLLAVLGLTCVVLLAAAAPAAARGDDRDPDRRINITGDVVVPKGETVSGLVASADGNARIEGVVDDSVAVGRGDVSVTGRVTGNVFVLKGDAIITGRVDGDIAVVDGRAIVKEGATVDGDVTSGSKPRVAPGTVHGSVDKLDVGSLSGGLVIAFLIALWVAVTLSYLILGVFFVWLFPRGADATVEAGRSVWASLGWGLLVGILGPVLGIAILTTLVGIPLGAGVLGAFGILSPLGYVAASLILGRTMIKGTTTGARFGAFFAGFGILRAAALIPGIGFIVGILAGIYGIGALVIAAWRAGHREGPVEPSSPVSTPTTTTPAPGTPKLTPTPAKKASAPPATSSKAPAATATKTPTKTTAKTPTKASTTKATPAKSSTAKTTVKKATPTKKAGPTKRS